MHLLKMDSNQSIERCLSASSINNGQNIVMSGIGSGGSFKVQLKMPNTSTMSCTAANILNSSSTTSLTGLSSSSISTPNSSSVSNSSESLEGLEINDTYRLMGKHSIGLGE